MNGIRAREVLAAVLAVAAGTVQAVVDHYDVDDGLSQNSVVAIAADARGLLWVGTEDGLNRFDGRQFKTFRRGLAGDGLSGGFIQRLARGGEALWIGTVDGGLSRMDLLVERIDPLAAQLPDFPPARETVHALLPLGETGVLVGTVGGLYRVDWPAGEVPSGHRIEAADGLPEGMARAIVGLRDGRLLAAIGARLCIVDLDRRLCLPYPLTVPPALDGVSILALAETTDGTLWVAFEQGPGVLRVAASGETRLLAFGVGGDFPDPATRVLSLAAGAGGDLWIGSDFGTFRYAHDCRCVQPRVDGAEGEGAARRLIYSLLPSSEGPLWMGVWNHGLDRYDPRKQAISRHRVHLPERDPATLRSVRAFVAEPARLWLGTYGGGVVEALLEQDRVVGYRQPAELRPATVAAALIWALAADGAGGLWIGGDDGLAHWRPGAAPRPVLEAGDGNAGPLHTVRSLLRDREGRLWVGAEGGLFRGGGGGLFRVVGDPPRAERMTGLPDRRVFALHQTPQGDFHLGTWSGVYAFDPERGGVLHKLAPEADIRVVWDIADAADGGLWVGSSDGLVHIGPNGGFRRYTEAEGLPNRVVYGIQADADGYLWLSTNRGIARFDPRQGASVAFGRYDGLQDTEFMFGSHARAPDGRLLFGGPGGFNRIDPSRIAFDDRPPRPLLTGVAVDGRELEAGAPDARIDRAAPLLERLRLSPEDSVLGIRFGAIAEDQPHDVAFRYRLVGFDRGWQDAGQRRYVQYTNLPPGDYAFEVEAISRFGTVSAAPRQLLLEVVPHWWQRSSVHALALLSVIAAAFALVRWRLSTLQAQRRLLEIEVAARTREISAQRDALEDQRTRLEHANAELAVLSAHDPLTSLPNRRTALARLDEAVAAFRSGGTALAVALADLDHFKHINDDHGHLVGDRALAHFGKLWAPALRAQSLLARYGGEEFLLILQGEDADSAASILQRLHDLLAEHPVPGFRPPLTLGASIGWAALGDPRESAEGLLKRADDALYRAKAAGRGRVEAAPAPGSA